MLRLAQLRGKRAHPVRTDLRYQPELGLASHPAGDPNVLQFRGLQVLQILLQRGLIKLRQKLRLGSRIESADLINDLTFGHTLLLSKVQKCGRNGSELRPVIGDFEPST